MIKTAQQLSSQRDRSAARLARSAAAAPCVICRTRLARRGRSCADCLNDLARVLREISDYWSVLPHLIEPTRGQSGRLSPGYGSRSPLRLDVLAALDPATLPTPEDDVWSIPGTIRRIADWIAKERNERPGPRLWFILTQLHWCAERPEFEDIAEALHELHRRAQALAHDRPEGSLGDCLVPGCDGQVLEEGIGGRCRACNRPYVGLGLVKLRVEQAA